MNFLLLRMLKLMYDVNLKSVNKTRRRCFMRKIFLVSFLMILVMSFLTLAVEKPESIVEKSGLNEKEQSDTFIQGKDFGMFNGRYASRSHSSTEAVYLNEGFEGVFPPAGWTLVNVGDGFVQTDLRVHTGSYSTYHNDVSGLQDDWLVTPAINLAGSVSARLNFWQNENYSTWYVLHQIYVTTDTTGIMGDTTAWNLVYEGVGIEDVWEQIIVDLSAYDNQTIFIGFYYSGNFADEWYLDDIIVEDAPTNPIMQTLYSELTAPPTTIGTTVADTFGIVRNAGGGVLNITSITLTNPDFAVNPSTGVINPGDTMFVLASFTPSSSGPITGLMIISGDDPNNPSDTIEVSGIGFQASYVTEEFNDWPYYPYNFTRINANGDAYQWSWYYSVTAGDTNYFAGIRWATAGNDDYLVTPPIPVMSGDFISFESWVYSASYPETWQVLVSTTDNQASSFTIGLDTVTSNITSPVRYTYDLSAFAGQTIYVAIRNISVDMYYQFVDNVLMPMPNYPVFINEVYYDGPGTDAGMFTELYGKPGMDLTGLILDGVNGNGGMSYRTINLSGVIPDSRLFVVAQDASVPNYNQIANVDWQNGPDNVILRRGLDTLDALGYGDFSVSPDDDFRGEGSPAIDVFPGVSLSRYPDGNDTNDNSVDFHATYPTPGEENHAPEPIIGGGSSLTFGTVAVGSDSSRNFIIYNNGSANLIVTNIEFTNPVFTATLPGTIAPQASDTITVTFAPTLAITYTDSMIINSNDAVNSAKIVSLTGTGEVSAQNATVILAAQIGGDSQYRSFWVNGSWDSLGVYDPNWSAPMVELKDDGVAPDAVAGDHIFTGLVNLEIDAVNTYLWWVGSENDDNSFLDDGAGFMVTSVDPVYPDTLVVDGDNGINEWVISLPGSFNGWNPSALDMTRQGTKWTAVVQLDPGTYEYKYAVMHQWRAAYGDGGVGGGIPNYSLTVVSYGGSYLFTFDDADNSQTVEPYIPPIFFDDFEAYTAGVQLAAQNPTSWTTWSNLPGSSEDPFISTAQAHSGVNSVNIIPNNDCVKPLANYTSGIYKISFYIYVPAGNGAYFNSLQVFSPPSTFVWGMQVFFDQNGQGSIDGNGQSAATFSYAYNTWLHPEVIVNLNTDWAEFYLDGVLVHGWQWTLGTFGTPGPLQLAANNFYGGGTTAPTNYYLDDYSITRLDVPTGILEPIAEIPTEFGLDQNYPNPFNPTTTIKYALKENVQVTLKVYNMLGQEVRTLVNGWQEAGYKQVVWDGLNNNGSPVASGIYIYQIQAGDFVKAYKMILMK